MNDLSLASITLETLQKYMKTWGLPAFRAKQVLDWRNKGVLDLTAMKNIPNQVKVILEEKIQTQALQLVSKQKSSDGTRKYLFKPYLSLKKTEVLFVYHLKLAVYWIVRFVIQVRRNLKGT